MTIDPSNPSIDAIAKFVGHPQANPKEENPFVAKIHTPAESKWFASLVEKQIKHISQVDGLTAKVAQKLNDLSDQKLSKETKYSPVRKVFEKLGQLLRGHGFKTEGEWIKTLANRCKTQRGYNYQSVVSHLTFYSEGINADLNKLSPKDFEEVVSVEALKLTGGKLYIFMHKLNDSKLDEFYKILVKRPNWFETLSSAYTRSGHEELFTPSLMEKFLSERNKLATYADSALYKDLLHATEAARMDQLEFIINNPEYSAQKETLINSLTLDEFRKLVNTHVLSLNDYARSDFYSLLKEDTHKNEFIAIVLKRKDWFEVLNDMSVLNEVTTDAVVEKFRSNKAFLEKFRQESLYHELDNRL